MAAIGRYRRAHRPRVTGSLPDGRGPDKMRRMSQPQPLVGVLMGSRSDWGTMSHTTETLTSLGVPFDVRVLSSPKVEQVE